MMQLNVRHTFRAMVLCAIVAAGAIGFVAASAVGSAGKAQESIVSVKLGDLISGLSETSKIRERLNEMGAEIRTYNDARQAEIKAIQAELETLEVGSPAHTALQEKLLMAAADLRAQMEVKSGLRDIEESKQYLHLYKKVVEAAAQLAQQAGYDFILLDDTDIQFQGGAPQQTLAQLFTRRLIYANPGRDVTEELMSRMNNAFQAGTSQ